MPWCLAALSIGALGACADPADPTCEEPVEAQVLDEHVTLDVGGVSVRAELADDPVEAERGWRSRRCELEALWIPFDSAREVEVTMCQVVVSLDVAFVRDGEIVAVQRAAPPCSSPCSACPLYGSGVAVDAILEAPRDTLEMSVGTAVREVP